MEIKLRGERPQEGTVETITKFLLVPKIWKGTLYWLQEVSIKRKFIDDGDEYEYDWKWKIIKLTPIYEKKLDLIVLSIVLGCLSLLFSCMILFIWIGEMPRAIMIAIAFIAMYFLLKPIIKKINQETKTN